MPLVLTKFDQITAGFVSAAVIAFIMCQISFVCVLTTLTTTRRRDEQIDAFKLIHGNERFTKYKIFKMKNDSRNR